MEHFLIKFWPAGWPARWGLQNGPGIHQKHKKSIGLTSIWARFRSISGQRGKKMGSLFIGLGVRIWGQLGPRLGSQKSSQKQENIDFLSIWAHFCDLLWGSLWTGPGPALSPGRRSIFPPLHFPQLYFLSTGGNGFISRQRLTYRLSD